MSKELSNTNNIKVVLDYDKLYLEGDYPVAVVVVRNEFLKEHPDYVVRITGSDEVGKGKLDYFIAVSTQFPVIATTSKLLSTGVDTKMVKVIVLDEMIGSMTEFKQIIGRGTRLLESEGKTNFVVLDFRNVSRMFADPKWDGPACSCCP